jgi:hypothetical protein
MGVATVPIRTIVGSQIKYYLISFDRNGHEGSSDPDGINGLLSLRLLEEIRLENPSNILLFSHGWQGDFPRAVEQYDRWIGAITSLHSDQSRLSESIPGFKPMFVGIHWPSEPWGDEELSMESSFSLNGANAVEPLLQAYIRRLGDTSEIQTALRKIFDVARLNADALTLPDEAGAAYRQLDRALGLASMGTGARPGEDRATFEPEQSFDHANSGEVADFGRWNAGGILAPLRELSFWTMKKRANTVGEVGIHSLLNQTLAASASRHHLMGHSFGAIVMSSALTGPYGSSKLPRPVDSLVLIQGALSLWSYSPDIPVEKGTSGYFHRIVKDGKVSGPTVTTRSTFDRAVSVFYPLAAGIARQIEYGTVSQFPKFGAVGAFGIQGLPSQIEDRVMMDSSGEYSFCSGRIYNLNASKFICHGTGFAGAHSDIAGPEVAHMLWQAAKSC